MPVFATVLTALAGGPYLPTREFRGSGFPVSTEEVPRLCADTPWRESPAPGAREAVEARDLTRMDRVTAAYAAYDDFEDTRGRYRVEPLPWGGARVVPVAMKDASCNWVPAESPLDLPIPVKRGTWSARDLIETLSQETREKPLPPSSSTQVVSVFPQGIDGTAPVTIARGDTIADGLLKLGTALHDSNGARLEWSLVYVPVLPFDEAIDDPGRWRLVLSAWLPPESRPRALSPETEP